MPESSVSRIPWSIGLMYSRGIVPPTILSMNSYPPPFSFGSSADHGVAVLALAAGLADEAPVALGRAADGLAVGDLRLADVGRDLELADHAVDEHVEVQLAHAGDQRLAGLLVGLDAEGRVLLGEALERDRRACPGRPWSWARSRPR